MEMEEGKLSSEYSDKISSIFKDFMARVTEFEELVDVGSRLLVGFHQGLEFLRQLPIDKTSELVKSIINANETKRLRSYLVSGCIKTHDGVQNISKFIDLYNHVSLLCIFASFAPLIALHLFYRENLHAEVNTCHVGLHDYLTKGNNILNQLESLLEDVISTLQTSGRNFPSFLDKNFADKTKGQTTDDGEEIGSCGLGKEEVTDFTLFMGIIYSMVKQDYKMQERIVSALNLESSSAELETYCLMWSLRPFVNDDILHQAWKLIP